MAAPVPPSRQWRRRVDAGGQGRLPARLHTSPRHLGRFAALGARHREMRGDHLPDRAIPVHGRSGQPQRDRTREVGPGVARLDHRNLDADLGRERLGEDLKSGSTASILGTRSGRGSMPRRRHVRAGQHIPDAEDVRVEHAPDLSATGLLDRAEEPVAGVVEHDVDPAEAVAGAGPSGGADGGGLRREARAPPSSSGSRRRSRRARRMIDDLGGMTKVLEKADPDDELAVTAIWATADVSAENQNGAGRR